MAKGKNTINKTSGTANLGYSNTPEGQDSSLKSHFMKMIEACKEETN